MKESILISGFGGQGMMLLGKLLAKAALYEGKHVTFIPSYGAEMRGGTAHCLVKISDLPIASPFIDCPGVAIILNQPSLDKFKDKLEKGSVLICNSDLVEDEPDCPGVKKVILPLNQIALDCGDIRVANMVILGLIINLRPQILKKNTIIKVLNETFPQKNILEQNLKAFYKGKELACQPKRKS